MPFHDLPALTLADTGDGMAVAVPVLISVGVLIAAVLIAGAVLLLLRRRLLSQDRQDSSGMGLMEHLQSLRETGEMSQEEYDAARRALVARATGSPLPDQGKPQGSTGRQAPGTQPDDGQDGAVLSAEPGYDLTGEPLPPSAGQSEADHDPPTPDEEPDERPDERDDRPPRPDRPA